MATERVKATAQQPLESHGEGEVKAEGEAEVKAREVRGFDDIPEPDVRVHRFVQNDKPFTLSFHPLTQEHVEAVRSSVPEPEAPVKPIPGKSPKELRHLQQQGFPTTYKDYNDPDYQAAIRQRETDLSLELVRVALRWGPMPGPDTTPEQLKPHRESFAKDIRRKLTAGNLQSLIDDVTATSFAISPERIASFFGDSPQGTPTDAA